VTSPPEIPLLAATSIATIILRRKTRPLGIAVALVGAYATSELVLFAATSFLGGGSNFTVGTVGYLAILNIIWLVGLVVACELPRLFDRGRKRLGLDEGWDRTCEYNLHAFDSCRTPSHVDPMAVDRSRHGPADRQRLILCYLAAVLMPVL
jgi:hypothetical protein